MFYFDPNKNQILEVHIAETYSTSDLERLLLFIDALTVRSFLQVSFEVHPSVKDEFLNCLDNSACNPTYQFNIN